MRETVLEVERPYREVAIPMLPDTGCAAAGVNSCFRCPFPKCIEEMITSERNRILWGRVPRRWPRSAASQGDREEKRRERNKKIVEAVLVEGLPKRQVAERFHLHPETVRRTVNRYLLAV